MRGGERKEGPPNKERGDGVGDGSLQSHSGVNLHPKTTKDRGNVPKDGEADGVSLTVLEWSTSTRLQQATTTTQYCKPCSAGKVVLPATAVPHSHPRGAGYPSRLS
jgi:hypothetical protein